MATPIQGASLAHQAKIANVQGLEELQQFIKNKGYASDTIVDKWIGDVFLYWELADGSHLYFDGDEHPYTPKVVD